MPIRKVLDEYQYDPENFNFDDFKKTIVGELDQDETAWRAAITTRDDTITKTSADLQKAQAKAWELLQQAPASSTDDSKDGDKPDENSMAALRARVFTTVERK